jgi:outer membrane lipoprotein-sorting protein
MRRYCLFLLFFSCCAFQIAQAADASALFQSLRSKVLSVQDYTADVKMSINVSYMRIPQLNGTLYYKAPDKMRLERNGGLSILPKKNINLTLSNLIPSGNVTVIEMGNATIGTKAVRVLKVIPDDDKSDIILTKIWVDETGLVALRTETTTRNDGTVTMDLEYARYTSYCLPDKVTIYMNLKDYKLPKGVTMDYNDQPQPPKQTDKKNQKGTIKITYLKYNINTGLTDKFFSTPEK